MHDLMLKAIVERCRQRISEGDCPTVSPFSVEQLEHAVDQLASMVSRASGLLARGAELLEESEAAKEEP